MGVDTPVLIIGAGPVGLTLACDLGWRSHACRVMEARPDATTTNPRCNTTTARSMEHFRRLGFSDRVRHAGLPASHPTDVLYLTRFTGHELARLRLPSIERRFEAPAEAIDLAWPTAEPQHRINQMYLEPILAEEALRHEHVSIEYGKRLIGFDQDDECVRARVETVSTGEVEEVTASYLVGCDGGRSTTRTQLGIKLQGDDNLGRTISVHFRSKALADAAVHGPAWMYWICNADGFSNVIALDGKELWTIHLSIGPETEWDAVDIETAIQQAFGADIELQIEGVVHWQARRLVADHYRSGRVFLAGDAAHIWIPMGGFGMNAGIGDATHLAWVLDAVLDGWGGDGLLDAYEAERRPVGDQVSHAAAKLSKNVYRWARYRTDPSFEMDGPAGEAVRAQTAKDLIPAELQQFNSIGIQLGYHYGDSPVVVSDGTTPPAVAFDDYVPTTRPGARLPHWFRPDGSSGYDSLTPGFTLLRLGPHAPSGSAFAGAADAVPLSIVDVPELDPTDPTWERPLILVRSDQHVVWRGNDDTDASAVIERVTGWAGAVS